ncbi:MAG: NUDIX domain-containing protein [Prevotella sp.]
MMGDNLNELLPVVDAEGNVTGSVLRAEAHNGSRILHPVVHLHVFNSSGELYLQKRPSWKSIQPDKWDTACGGHVDAGEEIKNALKREVQEELGITDYTPEFIKYYVFDSIQEKELVYVFKTIYDGQFTLHPTELSGGRFWSKAEIIENMNKGLFTPNFEKEYLSLFG